MSSVIISGCGKLNSDTIAVENEVKLNIIRFPNPSETPYISYLLFLSPKYVTNFLEFVDALNYYYEKGLELFLCGGMYYPEPGKKFSPVSIFYNGSEKKDIKLNYHRSYSEVTSITIANTDTPPTDWTYYNIKGGV